MAELASTVEQRAMEQLKKSNPVVIKRHQSLPTILRCTKNREGLVKQTLSPQKLQSAQNSPGKRSDKCHYEISPFKAPPRRERSPPTPRKLFQDDKENERTSLKSTLAQKGTSLSKNNAKPPKGKKPSRTKPAQSAEKSTQNQTKLTEFFSVRRSERKLKSEVEALQQKQIKDQLLLDSDDGLGLEIKQVPEKGRGIFAGKEISKGDFVVEYSGDLIDLKEAKDREGEYSMDLSKGCYMYYFKANNKQYCIDATQESGRLGRLVNHSRVVPNLRTKVIQFKGKPRLILVAIRDICVGEELLYDYGDRSKESLKAHPWLAL